MDEQRNLTPASTKPTQQEKPPEISLPTPTGPPPQPKPRKSYQSVTLKTSPPAVNSNNKPAPPVPKKPSNYSPVTLYKTPPIPPETSGKVDVKAIARELSQSVTFPDEASSPTENKDSEIQPVCPKRPPKKQKSADSAVLPPHTPLQCQTSVSCVPAATPSGLNWLPSGESMTLTELANTHSSRFPLRIRLLDGYFGQTSRFTFSSSDIFDIHFAKRTQVLFVKDSVGTDYTIPLNSAIQFGMIHGTVLQKTVQKPPLIYNTVHDLLSLDPLPVIVCATATWIKLNDKENKVGVEKDEILLVKGIFKSRLRGKKALKCFSMKTQNKKLLPEECEGIFSVSPETTKLHVYEFALRFKSLFPCKATIFLSSDKKDKSVFRNVPKALLQKPISVMKVMSEVSLAATSVSSKQSPAIDPETHRVDFRGKPKHSATTMEIPLDSHLGDLEAEILEAPSQEDTDILYMNTKQLLKNANNETYMILLDKGSDRINEMQSMFYMQIRSDNSDLGVTYEASEAVYETMEAGVPEEDIDQASYSYPRVFGGKKRVVGQKQGQGGVNVLGEEDAFSDGYADNEYEDLEQALQSVSFSSAAVKQLAPTLSPPHHLPSTSHNSLPRHLPPPQMQQHKFHLPESELRRERYTMTQRSNPPAITATSLPPLPPITSTSLPSPPPSFNPPLGKSTPYVDLYPPSSVTTSPRSSTFSVTPETKTSNKNFLQTMTEEEIQQLLMTMNMSQYQARFASEGIAGDILIELDEGDLRNDLGMKSKVHRVRLMKIIEGHHSAKKILEGESPYEL